MNATYRQRLAAEWKERIRKRFRSRKGGTLFRRMIALHSALLLLVAGLAIYFTTDTLSRSLTKDTTRTVDSMTEQAYDSASVLLNATYNYFGHTFANNKDLINAMYDGTITPLSSKRTSDLLINLKAANPFIESIYLYNFNDDVVYSSETVRSGTAEFYDRQMTNRLKKGELRDIGVFIPREATLTLNDVTRDLNLISLVFANPQKGKAFDGALVINLDQATLREVVASKGKLPSLQTMIVDREGRVISDSDPEGINRQLGRQAYIRDILASSEDRGQLSARIDGDSYLISYRKSDQLGWVFISMGQFNRLLEKVRLVQGVMLGVIGVYTLAAIVLAVSTMRSYSTPVRRLVRKLGMNADENPEMKRMNEFAFIDQWLQSQEARMRQMQHVHSNRLRVEKRAVLKALLHGNASGWDVGAGPNELDMALADKRCAAAILRVDDYSRWEDRYEPRDWALIQFAMMNIAQETMQASTIAEVIDDAGDSIVMLFEVGTQWTPSADAELFRSVQANIRRYLKLSTTIAIGGAVSRLADIGSSRNQAYLASKYRLIFGRGSIIPFTAEMSRKNTIHEYPYQLEKELMNAMKLGNGRRHSELTELFFAEVARFHYEEIVLYASQLIMMTERTAKLMTNGDETLQSKLFSLSEDLQKVEVLDDICEEYNAVCSEIMAFRDQESTLKNARMADKMKEMIHRDYAKPELTVDEVTLASGMSKNHARKVFQDYVGESISAYLSRHRFETAKRLLIETDYPAARICEMVGFSNANYFYISFKKYAGKTPNHFRSDFKADGDGAENGKQAN